MEVTPKGWEALGIDPEDDDCFFKVLLSDRARQRAVPGRVDIDAEVTPVMD